MTESTISHEDLSEFPPKLVCSVTFSGLVLWLVSRTAWFSFCPESSHGMKEVLNVTEHWFLPWANSDLRVVTFTVFYRIPIGFEGLLNAKLPATWTVPLQLSQEVCGAFFFFLSKSCSFCSHRKSGIYLGRCWQCLYKNNAALRPVASCTHFELSLNSVWTQQCLMPPARV